MTIIHLSSSLGGGGAEQMVLQLAMPRDPEVKSIVFSISEVNTLEPKFNEAQIEVYFLNITSFKNVSLKHGLKTLNAIIKDIENPVFHCHQFHGCLLGLLYNLHFPKIPIAFTLHSSTIERLNRKVLLFLTKPFRKKDIILSKNAKKWYLKNNAIIPNGVDVNELASNTDRQYKNTDTFRFLFLGRLSSEKNPLALISFAKQLNANRKENFIIDVVGTGILKDQFEKQVTINNLEDHISILGFQDNIKKFLDAAHCLILPSHWEGLPMVIIEAAAAKLPIISTPVGSIPDFLNNSNAYICTTSEFPDSMQNVMEDYDLAKEKANRLFNEINSVFNIDNVYRDHVKLYKSIRKIKK